MPESTNPRPTLTTQNLGIAATKVDSDLVGYILNPKDIEDAVVRAFTILGVDVNQIRTVKVASDSESRPHIIAEIMWKAVKARGGSANNTRSWTDFIEGDSDDGGHDGLDRKFYDALRNCAFHGKNKNLRWTKVVRGDNKYARIELDPYIFIAFAYNINFADKFYKISAPTTRWMSDEQLDELSGKERKKIMRKIQEYKSEQLRPCTFYVTFRRESTWTLADKSVIKNTFHPSQVEFVYSDEEDEGKKKKKRH